MLRHTAYTCGAMMQLVEQQNSKGVGLKAFSVAVPKDWNKLPMALRGAASLHIFIYSITQDWVMF